MALSDLVKRLLKETEIKLANLGFVESVRERFSEDSVIFSLHLNDYGKFGKFENHLKSGIYSTSGITIEHSKDSVLIKMSYHCLPHEREENMRRALSVLGRAIHNYQAREGKAA